MTSDRTTVLNVDDKETQRSAKTRALKAAGFTVIDTTTGAEALRLSEQHRPAVVLLDVQLPDISGYDVCRSIKKKLPEIMVLMISATFTTPESRAQGLDAGADSYLAQTADLFELVAAVNALLRICRSEDELRKRNKSLEAQVKTERALRQSLKMEAIEQLAGGLAHDFNNLLTAVVGNLELIRLRSAESNIRHWADNALQAAERGAKLTSQLLSFSRTQKLDTASVDVNALVDGMRDLLNQSLGAEKLLLVGDDPDAREIVGRILLDLGYDVRQAASGDAALAILGEFDPDLLVVDLAVAGVNDAEVVMAARQVNARLKVLFLSGFAESEVLETAVGATPVLRKPFQPGELVAAVRSALDGKSPPLRQ